MPLSQLPTWHCPKDKQDTEYPPSQKSLSNMLGLKAEDGCPDANRNSVWVTVWPDSCFLSFHGLEVACLHFLLTQFLLFPSWVSEGFEDLIATALVFQRKKANY